MDRCVLASGNAGKLREFHRLLEPTGMHIQPQSHWQVPPADENGLTFIENALIKARHACRHAGLPALADDSGLVVPALQGRPGIHSARYAGEAADDRSNVDKLLREMATLKGEQRKAWFQCVIVLLRHAEDPAPLLAMARWHGYITPQPCGSGGFGYDPVFQPTGRTCTAAELTAEDKDRLSHRGQALRQLLMLMDDG